MNDHDHDHDPTLDRIVRSLADDHAAHTILLYGSRADGTASPDSDYDIAAFGPIEKPFRIARPEPGGYLDVWVYPEARLASTEIEFLRLRGGRVLRQRGDAADAWLRALDALHLRGPDALAPDEIASRQVWAHKMADRLEDRRGESVRDDRFRHGARRTARTPPAWRTATRGPMTCARSFAAWAARVP